MAITLITGTPGSGKSYEAVAHHILPALRKGRKVITNLPFNVQHFKKFHPEFDLNLIEVIHASAENLTPFSRVSDFDTSWHDENGVGPLFVIDEAHMAFPRGDKDKSILEWFTLHRHTGADIILVTQQLNQMRREIGGLVEVALHLKKNGMLGSSTSYRRQARDGTKGAVISTSIHRYDPKIFPFYQSYTLGGTAEAVAQAKPIWFRWPFLAAGVLFLYVGYQAMSGGLNPFGGADRVIAASEAAKEMKSEPLRVVAPPPDPAPEPLRAEPIVVPPTLAVVPPETVDDQPVEAVPVRPKPAQPFDLVQVRHVTAVRLGDKCRVAVHIGDRRVESWELHQAGYTVRTEANDGEAREMLGSCSLYVVPPHAEDEEDVREFAWHMTRQH